MFLDSWRKVCDFGGGVQKIFKEGKEKDLTNWLSVVTPFVIDIKATYEGLLDYPNAIKDPDVASEAAKYFDEKFVFSGKLEEVDDELAKLLMTASSIVLKLKNG